MCICSFRFLFTANISFFYRYKIPGWKKIHFYYRQNSMTLEHRKWKFIIARLMLVFTEWRALESLWWALRWGEITEGLLSDGVFVIWINNNSAPVCWSFAVPCVTLSTVTGINFVTHSMFKDHESKFVLRCPNVVQCNRHLSHVGGCVSEPPLYGRLIFTCRLLLSLYDQSARFVRR